MALAIAKLMLGARMAYHHLSHSKQTDARAAKVLLA